MASKIRLTMATVDDHIRVCKAGALLSYVNCMGIQGKEQVLNQNIRNGRKGK